MNPRQQLPADSSHSTCVQPEGKATDAIVVTELAPNTNVDQIGLARRIDADNSRASSRLLQVESLAPGADLVEDGVPVEVFSRCVLVDWGAPVPARQCRSGHCRHGPRGSSSNAVGENPWPLTPPSATISRLPWSPPNEERPSGRTAGAIPSAEGPPDVHSRRSAVEHSAARRAFRAGRPRCSVTTGVGDSALPVGETGRIVAREMRAGVLSLYRELCLARATVRLACRDWLS